MLADEDDLRDVKSAVADLAGKWMDLGISLGIRSSKLDPINFLTPSDCLREMLALWLRQGYNVRGVCNCWTRVMKWNNGMKYEWNGGGTQL